MNATFTDKKTEKQTLHIEKITILHIQDTDPDTSWLGEHTDDLKDGVIVRAFGEYYEKLTEEQREEIPTRGWEFRGFTPYAGGEPVGTDEYYKGGLQDYARMEKLNNGDFSFIGIQAEAQVAYSIGGGSSRLETLTSGGLWGIESDSGDYIKEVEQEQLADLKAHLETLGIDVSDFDEKAENAKTVEK